MIDYAIYEIQTGILTQIGACPAFALEAQGPGSAALGLMQLPSRSWDYWVDVSATPHALQSKTNHPLSINKTTITADGIDECLITSIANPSTITWPDGQQDEITDGEVGFSVDLPGAYKIRIESIKHFTEEITVEALPAN